MTLLLFSVPTEPYSLKLAAVTSSSVTLQWMPPATPNGVITQYSLQYGGNTIDNFGTETLNMLMGTIEGISPDTKYVLQLRAHTRVGPGPPASLTIQTCKLLNKCSYIYIANHIIIFTASTFCFHHYVTFVFRCVHM